jgi:hypothetical protein
MKISKITGKLSTDFLTMTLMWKFSLTIDNAHDQSYNLHDE